LGFQAHFPWEFWEFLRIFGNSGNFWELLGILGTFGNYWELLGIIGNFWEFLGTFMSSVAPSIVFSWKICVTNGECSVSIYRLFGNISNFAEIDSCQIKSVKTVRNNKLKV
jgi:hypothetical protein